MTDFIDLSFDYWYDVLKKRKKEQEKKRKLKEAIGWIDSNEEINPLPPIKKSSII